jgi:hypothetical protein
MSFRSHVAIARKILLPQIKADKGRERWTQMSEGRSNTDLAVKALSLAA